MPTPRSAFVAGLLLLAAPFPVAAQFVPDGPFRLHSEWRGDDECLEANGPASPVAGGGAFMDACRGVNGQIWTAEPRGDGYFLLKARQYGDERCLESNGAASSVQGGAAFMDVCRGVTGQHWLAEPAGDGYFRLRSMERGPDECLESNARGQSSLHNGAAFMETCEDETGQFWRFVPETTAPGQRPAPAATANPPSTAAPSTMVVDNVVLQTGAVQITLQWARELDLDLHVTDPGNETISYNHKTVSSGGFLDVDSYGGCESTTGGSVENIVWRTNTPEGSYSMRVHNYDSCSKRGAEAYTLTLRHNGQEVRRWQGSLAHGAEATHTFSVRNGQFTF